jgi:hypothetical protein
MPLVKFQFKPGINKEITTLAGKGGWYSCNNVRFRSGYPEKIGGWVLDNGGTQAVYKPSSGNYWGVAKALFDWSSLAGNNYLGVGTNLKYLLQSSNGGAFYDITPLRATSAYGGTTFSATNGSKIITVTTVNVNGVTPNDFVTFSGAVSLGGSITAAILNAEFQVVNVVSTKIFTIQTSVAANSSDTGNGGASVVGAYQLITGSSIFSIGTGWGVGGWGGVTPGQTTTGWGVSSSASLSFGYQLRLWSQSNYGQNLAMNPRGGGLYYWVYSPNGTYRAQQLSPTNTNTQDSVAYWYTDAGNTGCPTIALTVLVSNASRFVIAYGTDNNGDGIQDPMLVSWSDQESITTWVPQATNQAGNYRLSYGSTIVTAIQTRQEIIIFTDSAIYSQQYIGPPYVWGFQQMAADISIISPNSVVVANNIVFWMGIDKFYFYNGTAQTLPSALRKYVFENINLAQSYQVFGGLNEGFSEIWWFYVSMNSSNDTIDSYIIYNYLDQSWAYGSMARTAWVYSPLRTYPMAAGYSGTNGTLIYHENGVDDGTTNPPSAISAYIQSSDADIGDGDHYGYAWRMIPDITFNGSNVANPSVAMTVWPRQNPGAAYTVNVAAPVVKSTQTYSNTNPYYDTQQFTQQVNIRVRGREMAMRISSNTLGVAWQLGIPRVDVKADGRRA